jgi:hypothetical protein|nr:MAG TPA: hypothetical protein [Caudoviricetes sp.]DAY98085.1 MAG TPA: hypothetical protein [Caudoviricetes sp.]
MNKKKAVAMFLTATFTLTSSVPVLAGGKDVAVTVPNYGFEEDDDTSSVPEAKETVVNEDGSTTYTLTKKQQKEWKKAVKSNFDDYIKDILDDDTNYPNVEDITYNNDMTEFEIDLATTNIAQSELFIGYIALFTAPVYQQVNGVEEKDVDYKVTVKDSSTGEETVSTYAENKADWESFNDSFTVYSEDTQE